MSELSQEQLLNAVARAINLLEIDGHVCTTPEIQAYLRTIGYDEPIERIKEATDIIYELRLENEDAQTDPFLSECPYCHQMHPADLIEQCLLNPKMV